MAKLRIRKRIPLSTQKKLIAELSGICCVPECTATEDLHIHHIDSDPSNNNQSNLILLCPNHHASAHSGGITKEQCREYRQRASRLRPVMPDLLRTLDTLVQALDDKRTFEHPEKVRAGKSVSDSSAPSNLELEAEKLEEESRELQRQVYDSLKERFGDRITPDEFRELYRHTFNEDELQRARILLVDSGLLLLHFEEDSGNIDYLRVNPDFVPTVRKRHRP